jgi:hypothetical protein
MPESTFRYYTKKHSVFRPTNTYLKPKLTPDHRRNRLNFVLSKIDAGDPTMYDAQFNTIHIDEKWFYMDKVKRKVYLTEDEAPPERTVRNKNYIEKVMFLAAVARPMREEWGVVRDQQDDWYFDGKVGLYPLVEYTRNVNVKNLSITADVFE